MVTDSMIWPSTNANGIPLTDPVGVTYQGALVVFAREAGAKAATLYYNVLRPNVDPDAPGDWVGWNLLPMLEPSHADSAPAQPTADLQPMLRLGGLDLVTVPPVAASPDPADAAFRVVCDGKYITCFRLSSAGTLYADRFILVQVPVLSTSTPGPGSPATTWVLSRAWEVRYRRSGQRDAPAGSDDTLDTQNMLAEPFLEPTTEIMTPSAITSAYGFAAVLAPTSVAEKRRYHFFSVLANKITAYSCAQDMIGRVLVSLAPESFSIEPTVAMPDGSTRAMTCTGGVAATVYEEQEQITDPDGQTSTVRRATRLMIAVPVACASIGLSSALAVYDFLVQPDGTIPVFPALTGCRPGDGTIVSGTFTPTTGLESYPVPEAAVHVVGDATATGILLGQPHPSASPFLLDGADGLVHAYFAGPAASGGAPFTVVQFSPVLSRAAVRSTWTAGTQSGGLVFVAARSGSTLNGLAVTVSDCQGQLDLCDLSIDYGSAALLPRESWKGVPREMTSFMAVLSGGATADANDPKVESGDRLYYDYSGSARQARLPLGSASSPTGHLTLASRRRDVPLAAVVVAQPLNNKTTLTITTDFGRGTATQTWQLAPAVTQDLVPVLRGNASPSTYSYTPAATDTKTYGLPTDAGAILLFAASGTGQVTLTVRAATDLLASHCDVEVRIGSGTPVVLTNVAREQTGFIQALSANPTISAALPGISPDPVAGKVLDQTVTTPLDLRGLSTLFSVVAPVASDTLVGATQTATTVQGHTLTPSGTAVSNKMVAVSAIPTSRPQRGASATMVNGAAAPDTRGQNGAWVVAHAPKALTLGAQDAITVRTTTPAAQRLAPGRTWTIETWCRPDGGDAEPIVCYNNGPAAGMGAVVPSYYIGTTGHPAVEYESYSGGWGSYINVTADQRFNPHALAGFTWEAWIRPNASPCPSRTGVFGCMVQGLDSALPMSPQFQFGLDSTRVLDFSCRTGTVGQPIQTHVRGTTALPAVTWTHVAVTGAMAQDKTWTFILYENGLEVTRKAAVSLYSDQGAPRVALGADDSQNVSLFGCLGEVRYWRTARTPAELDRTMNTSLSGREQGLVGYWPLTETPQQGAVFHNLSAEAAGSLNGTMSVSATQTVKSTADGTFLSIIAGVGGSPAKEAQSFLRSTHWNHVAAVYRVAGALYPNPTLTSGDSDYAACQYETGLGIASEATMEAWIQMDAVGTQARTIMSRWGVDQVDQAFQFGIANDGTLFCNINVTDAVTEKLTLVTVKSTLRVDDRSPHHVAATWSTSSAGEDEANPKTVATLSLYIDGSSAGLVVHTFDAAAVQVVSSSASFCLGISALETPSSGTVAIESQAPYQGLLTGVRFWSAALSVEQVGKAKSEGRAHDGEKGMVSAWWFDEAEALVAADSVSHNDLQLTSTDMWATFASMSSLDVYGNGAPVGMVTDAPSGTPVGYKGDTQFTVGAYISHGTAQKGLRGAVAELRLWKTARTWGQLQDAMYRGLLGSESGLAAYWTFDDQAADKTGRGNDGQAFGSPTYTPSAAPVANEGPEVKNLYGGPVTEFQEPLQGTPSVLEYGETELGDDDAPLALFKRAYIYVNPSLRIDTRYGMGELDLIYLGQVQTNPTLIGFIEGPPPVPSENLSRPLYTNLFQHNAYFDASSVSITRTETTGFTFSSSDYKTSITMDLDLKLGLFGNWKVNVGSPFFSTETFVNKLKIGLHQKDSFFRAGQTDTKYASSWTDIFVDTLGLRGKWEPQQASQAEYLNPLTGRRFLPANVGYALVESLTADLYMMRMRSTRAMVGRTVVPNLAIPPDRNIIIFQINPHYVKNGTLDGKVGMVNDPDYPNADTVRGSYFKPTEAYVLKESLERAEQNLEAFWNQLDSVARGKRGKADLEDVPPQLFFDFEAHVPKRGIANTYVWSAYGGLHKEEEQFAASSEHVYTGFYGVTWGIGAMADFEVAFKIGVYGGLDLLLGGQTKVQVAKGKSQSATLGLSVAVPGDSMLQPYDQASGAYLPEPCPGKVKSYRFMTFYLPPSQENADAFQQVVDQNWLQCSSDPDAIALRGAQIEDNGVWRVLHRVTYVNRVPPSSDTAPSQTVDKGGARDIAVDDNLILISLVEEALAGRTPTPANIGAALSTVLDPTDGSPSRLGQVFPWWQTFINTTHGTTPSQAAVALLNQIMDSALSYFEAGYASGVLPL